MSDQSLKSLEDEIFLKDIIDFLLDSWKKILLSGIIGLVLALVYAFISPTQYKADANIQVGKLAGVDIESPSTLIAKLRMPNYYSKLTLAACNIIDKENPGQFLINKINPLILKGSLIVNISYTSSSSLEAEKCLATIFDEIRRNQNALSSPILQLKNNQLIGIKKRLETNESFVNLLSNKNLRFDFSDEKFSANALLLATFMSKENEITDLRAEIMKMEASLEEPETKAASLVTPISIIEESAMMKLSLIMVVGVFSGLLVGSLIVVGKRSFVATQ